MVRKEDSIRFESRYELDLLIRGLEKYVKEHPFDESWEKMNELKQKLETMWLNW